VRFDVQARAKEAEECSKKILEEERAREANWRQAILQVLPCAASDHRHVNTRIHACHASRSR
jgi:hypothetical protein